VRPMRALVARHSVLALQVRDPREDKLPAAGRLVLSDPETGQRVEADTGDRRLREAFEAAAATERAEVARELRAAGAEHSVLYTEGPWLDSLGRSLS
ncbi:MAG: DUF58 domain-containing protein, partial [Thermoleophilaceae bacterium]|nr:DUF58 domain-containing protein [Thermoleophilaceae bacterium]